MCPLVGSADPLAATEGGMVDMNYDDMPAGREMNDAVCVAVGIEPVPGLYTYPIKRISDTVIEPDWDDEQPVYPGVSTEPGPAWTVVEKMHEYKVKGERDTDAAVLDACVWATFQSQFYMIKLHEMDAGEAALAICRAAHKAVKGRC